MKVSLLSKFIVLAGLVSAQAHTLLKIHQLLICLLEREGLTNENKSVLLI